jgi:hypothetical protein
MVGRWAAWVAEDRSQAEPDWETFEQVASRAGDGPTSAGRTFRRAC